jgi:hypothetical protein
MTAIIVVSITLAMVGSEILAKDAGWVERKNSSQMSPLGQAGQALSQLPRCYQSV